MAELLSLITLILCFATILAAVKFFGKTGLFAYSVIAAVISNIQVLRLTKYSVIDNPVALGTVIFSTLFAVDNILTEYYGPETAGKCVLMNFMYYLFFTLMMKIANSHPVIDNYNCMNLHSELKAVFSPGPALFVSSAFSYVASQFIDIFIFSTLKKITKNKYISLRSFISMALSTLADNFIFSFLAWVIFAENPTDMSSLWKTYIFVTFAIRLIIAVLCVPLVKLCGALILEKEKSNV